MRAMAGRWFLATCIFLITEIFSCASSTNSARSVSEVLNEANVELKKGLYENAEDLFQEALVLDPGSAAARFGVASCRYAFGELVEARRLVTEFLAAYPKDARALGLAGIIAWRQGDLRLAAGYLDNALKFGPRDALLHSYMGVVLNARGKQRQALKHLRKAAELDAGLSDARFNLAVMLALARRPKLEEARKHYEAALGLGAARDDKLERLLYAK